MFLCVLALAGCVREQPQVIVITATFPSSGPEVVIAPSTQVPPLASAAPGLATLPPPVNDGSAPVMAAAPSLPAEHVVQAGDTLFGIAQKYGVSLESLMAANTLINPDVLSVGQIIALPNAPTGQTPALALIPDSRFVRGPGSGGLDIAAYIASLPGYIKTASDTVTFNQANGAGRPRLLTAAQVVEEVSLEYSVDPRLLLTTLEYRAGWLSNPAPLETLKTFPLISEELSAGFDRAGLYKQLSWAANELNRGYYAWKGRGLSTLEFKEGTRLQYAPTLNAGTIGLQYWLSLNQDPSVWQAQVGEGGFMATYRALFGDPFSGAFEVVPANLLQPDFSLPFASGEVWYYTGGHHGGWGSGSAWSAIDFAPPDERTSDMPFCYTSQYAVRAVAPGAIARSADGALVLDLDGDGDETTGWTVLYLHMDDLTPAGTRVNAGDPVGRAACAGGFSNATHLHIARRYNGEWIPADCSACRVGHERPSFIMSGWVVVGYAGQEYQGAMQKGSTTLQAEQSRLLPVNHVSW
jgi:LasA protease